MDDEFKPITRSEAENAIFLLFKGSKGLPPTLCTVVYQGDEGNRHVSEFSVTDDREHEVETPLGEFRTNWFVLEEKFWITTKWINSLWGIRNDPGASSRAFPITFRKLNDLSEIENRRIFTWLKDDLLDLSLLTTDASGRNWFTENVEDLSSYVKNWRWHNAKSTERLDKPALVNARKLNRKMKDDVLLSRMIERIRNGLPEIHKANTDKELQAVASIMPNEENPIFNNGKTSILLNGREVSDANDWWYILSESKDQCNLMREIAIKCSVDE